MPISSAGGKTMSSEFSLTFLAADSTGVISRAFNSARIFFTDSGVEPLPTTVFRCQRR